MPNEDAPADERRREPRLLPVRRGRIGLAWGSVFSRERRARPAFTSRGQHDPGCRVQDALSARSNAGRGSSIGRTGPGERRRLRLATKKQKARAAAAGTNPPAKAKPKKKTSRGK